MSKIVNYVIQLLESIESKTLINQGIGTLVETNGGVMTG